MTNIELYELTLLKVKAGDSIGVIVKELYKTWPHYKKTCSEAQRKEIKRFRDEVLERNRVIAKLTPRVIGPRVIFITTDDLSKRLDKYCKQKKITRSYFLNVAITQALVRLGG